MEAQFKVPSVQGAAPPPPDPGTPEAGEPEAGVGVAVGPSWPLFSPGLSPAQLPLSMHISWLWLPSWTPPFTPARVHLPAFAKNNSVLLR